ncbi:MAG TPA: tetratricopeptide repeat protein, partial [Terriglobales bacterium]
MKWFAFSVTLALIFCLEYRAQAQPARLGSTSAQQLLRGLVVTDVEVNGQAGQKGLKPGDILLSWQSGAANGDLESPFDLTSVFLEQTGRGPVIIFGARNSKPRRWEFGSDSWGIAVRPRFQDSFLSRFKESEQNVTSGQFENALTQVRSLAAETEGRNPTWLNAWLLVHAAKNFDRAKKWERADALYQQAIQLELKLTFKMDLLRQWAVSLTNRKDFESAVRLYREILSTFQNSDRHTMVEANALLSLAVIELQAGDYGQAEMDLNRARVIDELLAPKGIQTALVIANLGIVYQDEGELSKAEQYYLKALDKEERYFPGSLHLQRALTNLAVLFDQEGDFNRAEPYHRRALRLAAHNDPTSLEVAEILSDLSGCLLEEGRLAAATAREKRALSIREASAPVSLATANSLAGMGKISRAQKHLDEAERYYQRALSIMRTINAPERDQAAVLMGLAAVFKSRREFSKAEGSYREALAIVETQDPQSVDRGTILAELAGARYREGERDDAAQLYRQAMGFFENGLVHLSGISESRSRYRAEHLRYHQEYSKLLLESGQPEQAFEEIESARARTLVEMLSNGHARTMRGDPSLLRRAQDLYGLLTAKSEYRLSLLSRKEAAVELARTDREIDDLLLQFQQVQSQLAAADPGDTQINTPQTLKIEDIQHLLGPDTLLLEYTLSADKSQLWVVSNTTLKVFDLPGRSQIEGGVRKIFRLLNSGTSDVPVRAITSISRPTELDQITRRMTKILLGPIKEQFRGKRLAIVAEGALEYLPFSALLSSIDDGQNTPLIANHEIVYLPSASALAQLRNEELHRKRANKAVAILADPVFNATDERVIHHSDSLASAKQLSSEDEDNIQKAYAQTRGNVSQLGRLLYTRNEAQAVLAVSPANETLLALDFSATRNLAMSSALADYRIVHFATHGVL